jgi:GWxTD domain-containing protein
MREIFIRRDHHMIAGLNRAVLFVLLIVSALFSSQQKSGEQNLPEKYLYWIDLTSYIILPAEREVFFQLQNDRDRDIFIESFWKQRDPTPETPQNELKEEHLLRVSYANTNLRRATPREGWRTDMGRMHIILGPPASIERFDSQPGVHPCQVWYYRGQSGKGLPALFALVFYQRGGSGEYKLYNPAADGPASLLVRPEELDQTDYEAVYQKIKELTPSLAPVVLSVIPGEFPYAFTPSPQNSILLAKIIESPRKDVNPRYATDFLHFKGMVSTEYLTNYVESSAVVAVIPDPVLDVDLLHFSISPKRVSADYYQPRDQYYCNFKLNVSLRKGGQIIFQHERDFPLYFSPDRKGHIEANGLAVEEVIPVAEGEYELAILLQNSVGKEFSYIEKKIQVPARGGAAAQLIGPIVGYRLQTVGADALLPFKALDRQISVDSSDTLSRRDELAVLFALADIPESLWREGRARIKIKGLKGEEASEKEFFLGLSDHPYKNTMVFSRGIPAAEFSPDYYEVGLAVLDGEGKTLMERTTNIILSALENVSHPVTLVLPSPPAMNHLLFYGLAYQYAKLALPEKAEAFYEKALAMNPEYKRGIIEYAGFLVNVGKFDKGLSEAERVRDNESLRFQYALITGLAHMGKGNYEKAISFFLEGNRVYNSDVQLLNSLGTCYYKTGQKKDALEALNASLSLNPEQKDIKDLINRIHIELK